MTHFRFGPAPAGVDVMWRVDAQRYSYIIDAEADRYGVSDPRLEATWWLVKKRTPKGVRLETGQFILLSARKRWACPTIEEALDSFKARKRAHISLLQENLRRAQQDLALAEECITS